MITTEGCPEGGASRCREIDRRGPAMGETTDHSRHVAIRVDESGVVT